MHRIARGRRQEAQEGPPDAEIKDDFVNMKPQWPNIHDSIILDVLRTIFNFVLGPTSPWVVPGEGPDCPFRQEIGGFGPSPARI